ncbi:50S ribosomal protein L24 [bacterium]|nr:50S ribosomal protein L24 [bacterium]
MKCKIRKGDLVEVISGPYRARKGEPALRGRVLEVYPKASRVLVEGVNHLVHHEKVQSTQGGQTGGIIEREEPIHISNIALVDPKTDKPVRVGIETQDDGRRVRVTRGRNSSGSIVE